MTQIDRDQTPADLTWVAERLERERPTATPLELDHMKLQARTQAMRGARSQAKGSVLKSRVAITAIVALGLFTGGTGTTLALSDSDSGSAAKVQYPSEGGKKGAVLGEAQGNGETQGNGAAPNARVLGETQSSGGGAQATRQVVATKADSKLPFTGLAAIPLVVLGLGLIGTGMMLFRSSRRAPTEA